MEMENLLGKDKKLLFNKKEIKHVAYIQCVGSRGPQGLPECSRYCCQAAIKQSIALREKGIQVTIFDRDIRVYHHEAETMYRQAREMGVTFIRYKPGNEPKLIGDKSLKSIQYKDKILNEELEFTPDLLVLSVGMRPAVKSMEEIQHFLKVPTGMDGFLLEKHPINYAKLPPDSLPES